MVGGRLGSRPGRSTQEETPLGAIAAAAIADDKTESMRTALAVWRSLLHQQRPSPVRGPGVFPFMPRDSAGHRQPASESLETRLVRRGPPRGGSKVERRGVWKGGGSRPPLAHSLVY